MKPYPDYREPRGIGAIDVYRCECCGAVVRQYATVVWIPLHCGRYMRHQ